MVEAVRQQRNYKDLSHAEIMALIQAYGQIKNNFKADSYQPCRTEPGTEKGMACYDGTGQRSIDDVAECGGPKEKLAMRSLICVFPVDKYMNKSDFKMA